MFHNALSRCVNIDIKGKVQGKQDEIAKKCFSVHKQFLEICSTQNLMDYSPSAKDEGDDFVIHQNDQSILSLLFKINNIKTFPIPFYNLFKTNIIAQASSSKA